MKSALYRQTYDYWAEDPPNAEFWADFFDYGYVIFLAAIAGLMIWRRLRN